MDKDFINLKHKALIQESDALTNGFRAGIRSLCGKFFGKELLTEDLKLLSDNCSTSEEESLTKKVLSALQSRVKADSSALTR